MKVYCPFCANAEPDVRETNPSVKSATFYDIECSQCGIISMIYKPTAETSKLVQQH